MIQITLVKSDILKAIEKAKDFDFSDNLRNRHPVVAFDNKLRGYVGEIAFENWLKRHNVQLLKKNVLDSESGMDIDFVVQGIRQERLHIELKTSLLPDKDGDLDQAVQNRDIKLMRRANYPIEDLHGDVHVQILFNQLRLRKEEWLRKKSSKLLRSSSSTLYQELAAHRYMRDIFMVGWIDKKSLMNQINNKSESLRIWKYGQRQFWTCNLQKEAKNPLDLIKHLTKA